jgi:hypothetical protein
MKIQVEVTVAEEDQSAFFKAVSALALGFRKFPCDAKDSAVHTIRLDDINGDSEKPNPLYHDPQSKIRKIAEQEVKELLYRPKEEDGKP